MAWRFPLIFLILLLCLPSFAPPLSDLAGGKHSFTTLGDDYYVPVPMKSVARESRLVLFNKRAAKHFGIELPSDPEELEKVVLDALAKVVAPDGQGGATFIATRYQDSSEKTEGMAQGDGRAVWSGELVFQQKDGTWVYLDVSLKGVGRTPLAWTKHKDPLHNDGWQSMQEAVQSFLHSEVNFQNQIDSTMDLAVMELPFLRKGENGGEEKAAITVRIGNQTRIGHLRYFKDNPEKFASLVHYIVRRDLGLAPTAVVGPADTEVWVKRLAENLGEEAARVFDLNAVHAAPTAGNRTTKGSSIDLAAFRYLDAHHAEYPYSIGKLRLGGEYGQTEQLRNYLDRVFSFMKEAKYVTNFRPGLRNEVYERFESSYQEHIETLWLTRVGLSPSEIVRLSPKTKKEFVSAVNDLYQANGVKKFPTEKGLVRPAAFDVRQILSQTMSSKSASPAPKTLDPIFESSRPWSTLNRKKRQPYVAKYELAVDALIKELNADESLLGNFADRAKALAAHERNLPGSPLFGQEWRTSLIDPVVAKIRSGSGFVENSQLAEDVGAKLVDPGLPKRARMNLGAGDLIWPAVRVPDPCEPEYKQLAL